MEEQWDRKKRSLEGPGDEPNKPENLEELAWRRGRSSKYRGVCWLKQRKAWRARIEVHGKREHLGYFDSEERAAEAYDKRALRLNGLSARLNFPKAESMEAMVKKQKLILGSILRHETSNNLVNRTIQFPRPMWLLPSTSMAALAAQNYMASMQLAMQEPNYLPDRQTSSNLENILQLL